MFEFFTILLLIGLNGLFAMSEIAIVSSRRAKLQHLADSGNSKAKAALYLSQNPNHFLSTIQVGITLIAILSGAIGEATFSQPLAEKFRTFPIIAPYSDTLAFVLVVLILTYFSLIIGELVPKRLALLNPEGISILVASPLRLLSRLVFPVVRVLSFSTEWVLRGLGSKPTEDPPVTEEEIKVLMAQGAEAGVFEKFEQDLVRNIFRLGSRSISGIMVPRLDFVYLDLESSQEDTHKIILTSGHTRFPVCKGGLDNLIGVFHTKDILEFSLLGQPVDLAKIVRPPIYVPESMPAMALLEKFKHSKGHIAFVVDEYGEIQGLVTLRDILEAVVGAVPSHGEITEQLAVQREDGSWLLDGMLDIDQLKDILQVSSLPDEASQNYNTLSGFVMMQMGRVPNVADHFEWHETRFEIMDMDGNRIDKVLVNPSTQKTELSEAVSVSDKPDRDSPPTSPT